MEVTIGDYVFSSNFECGNLSKVEQATLTSGKQFFRLIFGSQHTSY